MSPVERFASSASSSEIRLCAECSLALIAGHLVELRDPQPERGLTLARGEAGVGPRRGVLGPGEVPEVAEALEVCDIDPFDLLLDAVLEERTDRPQRGRVGLGQVQLAGESLGLQVRAEVCLQLVHLADLVDAGVGHRVLDEQLDLVSEVRILGADLVVGLLLEEIYELGEFIVDDSRVRGCRGYHHSSRYCWPIGFSMRSLFCQAEKSRRRGSRTTAKMNQPWSGLMAIRCSRGSFRAWGTPSRGRGCAPPPTRR